MITEKTINQVREIDLVQALSPYVEMKRKGRHFFAMSPWKRERTPSLCITPSKNAWKDFSSGKGGVGAVSFVMEFTGLPFPKSVEELAASHGIEVEYEDGATPAPNFSHVFDAYMPFFKKSLLMNREAMSLLRSKGISMSSISEFGIGFCPEGVDMVGGVSYEAYQAAEIWKFKGRIVFPVRSASGRIVALSGRALGDGHPKYTNSSGDVYEKSDHLYGLSNCRFNAQDPEAILVEGQSDVIAIHVAGLPIAIGKSGGSLSKQQAAILGRRVSSVTLMPDADLAGKKSIIKDAGLLLREGVFVWVQLPPDGEDPGSWFKHKDQFTKGGRVSLGAYVGNLYNKTKQQHRSKLIGAFRKAIGLCPEPVLRKQIISDLVEATNLSEADVVSGSLPEPSDISAEAKSLKHDVRFKALQIAIENQEAALKLQAFVQDLGFCHDGFQAVWRSLFGQEIPEEYHGLYADIVSYPVPRREYYESILEQAKGVLVRLKSREDMSGASKEDMVKAVRTLQKYAK